MVCFLYSVIIQRAHTDTMRLVATSADRLADASKAVGSLSNDNLRWLRVQPASCQLLWVSLLVPENAFNFGGGFFCRYFEP